MCALTGFLQGVVYAGRLLLREPLPAAPDVGATRLLEEAYCIHAMSVAGPPIPFDVATATAAGRVLYRTTWYLLNPNAVVEADGLAMPSDPRTAAQHLSADVVLRYLPAVHRRARALR